MKTREIRLIHRSRPTIEGAGVHLKRAFGFHQVPQFDPFLLLDDFHSSRPQDYTPGFPWHPHRGIETITYVLDGLVEHGDSMGNKGVIGAGDVQWMTAGGGIIHQEMPKKSPTGTMWGFQLWANLPSSSKMMAPRYRGVTAAEIPEADLGSGVRAKIITGGLEGVRGPVGDIVIDPEFVDLSVPPSKTFIHPVRDGHTVFAYVLSGEGCFDERRDALGRESFGEGSLDVKRPRICGPETIVLYAHEGNQIVVTTQDSPVRFLLVSGKPIREPIAWYGPIVMNTQDELRVAFDEFENGTFVKKA